MKLQTPLWIPRSFCSRSLVLQVVKEFRGDSAPGREDIGSVFVKSNLDVLLLPLWHIKKQILDKANI